MASIGVYKHRGEFRLQIHAERAVCWVRSAMKARTERLRHHWFGVQRSSVTVSEKSAICILAAEQFSRTNILQ